MERITARNLPWAPTPAFTAQVRKAVRNTPDALLEEQLSGGLICDSDHFTYPNQSWMKIRLQAHLGLERSHSGQIEESGTQSSHL
jgi:hypothetical protein